MGSLIVLDRHTDLNLSEKKTRDLVTERYLTNDNA